MANNFQVTQGSGITIRTDDIGGAGVHIQWIKRSRGSAAKETSDTLYAVIAASSSGDNTIISAVASKVIRILGYVLSASAAVNSKWKSAATDKSGLTYHAANGGVAVTCEDGMMQGGTNEAWILNLSSAVAVGGHIWYVTE